MSSRIDYEQIASDYARHRTVHPGVLDALIRVGMVGAQSTVVEVGSGTGNYSCAVQVATGCTAIGVEPSPAMIEQARRRKGDCAWYEGRAESLPIDDRTVDLLFTVDVIHHVEERSTFFNEAKRVLRAGGRICTATDSEEDIRRRRPLGSHFPETIAYELNRYPRIETLISEMSSAGIEPESTVQVELKYELTDVAGYRDKAYSSLHLISDDAFMRGLRNLESEVAIRPIAARSLYTLVWGVV